jgi:hypothetical protein
METSKNHEREHARQQTRLSKLGAVTALAEEAWTFFSCADPSIRHSVFSPVDSRRTFDTVFLK